ncbi:hypothetical protein RvY_17734 [Ramazzottius varieornatus]|uniref:Pre-rRNA-processing protein TSR2 homolog n=1 Tax=Ramazzottius varieornatus TaxID=947166 RepID=A0A1D1W3D5_RAMVA|nr:hypothetical protein RvY_17734 [Ramazzottius varieornatus]
MLINTGLFGQAVRRLFGAWTALRLAVEHSLGGRDSQSKALDFEDAVVYYFQTAHNINASDLAEELLKAMEGYFPELMLDDASEKEIAEKLLLFAGLLQRGDADGFHREFDRLPGSPGTAASVALPDQLEISGDDVEMDLSESMEAMAVEEPTGSTSDNDQPTSPPRRPRNEPDADGWTTVTGSHSKRRSHQ